MVEAGTIDEAGEEVGDAGVRGDEAPRTDPDLDNPPAAGVEGVDDGASADPKGSRPCPSPGVPTTCGDGAVSRSATEARCPSTEATPLRGCASTEGEAAAATPLPASRPRDGRGDVTAVGVQGAASAEATPPAPRPGSTAARHRPPPPPPGPVHAAAGRQVVVRTAEPSRPAPPPPLSRLKMAAMPPEARNSTTEKKPA